MQLTNSNPSADISLNALLPAGAPTANGPALCADVRAAFPEFDSFLADSVAENDSECGDAAAVMPGDCGQAPLPEVRAMVISCSSALARWVVPTETSLPATIEESDSESNVSPDDADTPRENSKPLTKGAVRMAKATPLNPKINGKEWHNAAPDPMPPSSGIGPIDLPAVPVSTAIAVDADPEQKTDTPDNTVFSEAKPAFPGISGERKVVAGAAGDARHEATAMFAGGRKAEQSENLGHALTDNLARVLEGRDSRRESNVAVDQPLVPPANENRSVVAQAVLAFLKPGPIAIEGGRPVRDPLSFKDATEVDVAEIQPPAVAASEPKQAAAGLSLKGTVVPSPVWAEFAAAPGLRNIGNESMETVPMKTFLSAEEKPVTSHEEGLGIDVAKFDSKMSSRFSSPTLSSPTSVGGMDVTPLSTAMVQVSDRSGGEAVELPPASAAHEAVEVVMRAAEQMASRGQTSVRLQFSVGDARLDVRVELHANEVRTQFRTDSAELRQVLSSEWQSVSREFGQGDRVLRVAPAVFSAQDQSGFGAFSGDSSSRQRESRASRDSSPGGPRAIAALSGGRAIPAAVSAVPRVLRSAPPTSQHLHILA